MKKYKPMILVVDGGSTKMEWAVLEADKVLARFQTCGFNPNYSQRNALYDIVFHDAPDNLPEPMNEVYYFGTGCTTIENCNMLHDAFKKRFPLAEVYVGNDMMSAALALLGNKKGIACILGTGSNACYYDGSIIVKSTVSLGYVLGDEGSGCQIGKTLIRDFFYGIMPVNLRKQFFNSYHIDRESFLKNTYQQAFPSRYLASFAEFATENIDNEYIIDVCKRCFNEFIDFQVMRLSPSGDVCVGFVGSVAFHHQEVLRCCLSDRGLACGNILKDPMDGLIEFYRKGT